MRALRRVLSPTYNRRMCYSTHFTSLTNGRPVFKITQPIDIIQKPKDFYQQLLTSISQARHRICLSSLYIGSQETGLVDALDRAMARQKSLKVYVLLDCLRGTRTDHNTNSSSAQLLAPLVRKYGEDRCRVSLYHTPALNGLSKRWWPQRYNEAFGLQHIKAYVFDNEVVVSGANLSRDYFTNRQDRYALIKNQGLTDYFDGLIKAVGSFSFGLTNNRSGDYKLVLDKGIPDPSQDPREFIGFANANMAQFLEQEEIENMVDVDSLDGSETLAIPTVQMSQLGITQDEEHMQEFFRITNHQTYRNVMASAYFNFSDFHKHNVLDSASHWDLLVAAPRANGFFTARGISKYIPDMYSLIEHQFLKEVERRDRSQSVEIVEYDREGWTFHGKGVWSYLDQDLPQVTMIGSPNYGYRSIYCDLEAQVTLLAPTRGENKLQRDLHKEAQALISHAHVVGSKELKQRIRGSPLWLYGLKPFIVKKM